MSKYIANLRMRLPCFGRPLFIVFLLGRDERALSAAQPADAQERRHNPAWATVFVGVTLFLWVFLATAVFSFLVLYLAKSYAGIDLIQGSHPVPEFLRKIGLCH